MIATNILPSTNPAFRGIDNATGFSTPLGGGKYVGQITQPLFVTIDTVQGRSAWFYLGHLAP